MASSKRWDIWDPWSMSKRHDMALRICPMNLSVVAYQWRLLTLTKYLCTEQRHQLAVSGLQRAKVFYSDYNTAYTLHQFCSHPHYIDGKCIHFHTMKTFRKKLSVGPDTCPIWLGDTFRIRRTFAPGSWGCNPERRVVQGFHCKIKQTG